MPDVFGKKPPMDDRTARVGPGPTPPKMKPGHKPDATPMGTASWPGLPGGSQSKARGPRNVRQSAKQDGV